MARTKAITLLPGSPAGAEGATSAAEIDADVAWRVRLLGSRNAGCSALRALLEEESDPTFTRSDGEQRMLALVRTAKLPQPLVNTPLYGFDIDFYWPAHRVVVEIDSYGFHTTRWAYDRDCDKDAVLRSHGMPPLRFSHRQVRDEPLLVIAQVAQALAAAGAWAGAPPPSTPSPAGPEAAAR